MADDQYNPSSHSSLYESSIVIAQEANHPSTGDEPTTEKSKPRNGAVTEKGISTLEGSNFNDEAVDLPLPELSDEKSLLYDDGDEANLVEAANPPLKAANISWADGFPSSVPLPEPTNTPYNSSSASLRTASEVSVAATPSNALIRVNDTSLVPPPLSPPLPNGLPLEGSSELPVTDQSMSVLPQPPIPPPPPPPPPPPRRHKKDSKAVARRKDNFFQFRKRRESAPSVPPLAPVTYMQTIEALSAHLPHLVNTLKRTRRHGVNVTCFDYVDNLLVTKPPFTCKTDFEHASERIRNSLRLRLKDDVPFNVGLRLIVVEDLSVELIELLGSTFSISPEFFEEHLLNSGWQNGAYQDREADTWNTRGMKKNYASIRWYRPVMPALRRSLTAEGRAKLLDLDDPKFTWTEPVLIRRSDQETTRHGVKHEARLTMNILRRDWDLKTKVSDEEETTLLKSPVAWEERATVWSKEINGCSFGKYAIDSFYSKYSFLHFSNLATRSLANS